LVGEHAIDHIISIGKLVRYAPFIIVLFHGPRYRIWSSFAHTIFILRTDTPQLICVSVGSDTRRREGFADRSPLRRLRPFLCLAGGFIFISNWVSAKPVADFLTSELKYISPWQPLVKRSNSHSTKHCKLSLQSALIRGNDWCLLLAPLKQCFWLWTNKGDATRPSFTTPPFNATFV
jgi:hypothetical protein